jgi:4-amino-4-deoxy-L-arabinose transferase-like glycosyltransferase
LVLVLLLGFALRLGRLADKNIWWDEGDSAWQAPMSLAQIALYQARDQHPPLYYWSLHYWYRATGPSLFALRMLSVALGTLGIAAAYALGKRVFRRQSLGLTAALLLAISRFHIEWSQEIKMYAMVSTLSMLSLLQAVRIWQRNGILSEDDDDILSRGKRAPKWSLWLGYVLISLLAIYCHYIALLVLLGQTAYMLLVSYWRFRARRPWAKLLVQWAVVQVSLLAAFAPWLLFHSRYTLVWKPLPVYSPLALLRLVATLLGVGTSLHVERYNWQVAILWLPVLITLWPRRGQGQDNWANALVWILLVVPWFLTYLLTLPVFGFGYEAKVAARFFILCQTPYDLLLARGLHTLGRSWGPVPLVALLLVVGLQAAPLQSYYAGRYLRDDYGTLARTIQAYGRQGEAVMLLNDLEWPMFHYAYKGTLPWYHVPYGAPGGKDLIPFVAPAWEGHEGIWLVIIPESRQQDPEQAVCRWLGERGQVMLDEHYEGRRLVLYRRAPRELVVSTADGYAPEHKISCTVTEGITLEGYDQALHEIRTGSSLHIASIWRMSEAASSVQVRAGLVTRQGTEAGPTSEPAMLTPPPAGGGLLRTRNDVAISAGIPSGYYRVRLYLQAVDSQSIGQVDLGLVRIMRTMSPLAQQAQYSLTYRLGGAIMLRGYDLERDSYHPGEQVGLVLYWEAQRRVSQEYVVFTHILGQQLNPRTGNPLWGQIDNMPVEGQYPTSSWLAGETIIDRYLIPIDRSTPRGSYSLEIGMYSPYTGERLPVFDEHGQALGDHIILRRIAIR